MLVLIYRSDNNDNLYIIDKLRSKINDTEYNKIVPLNLIFKLDEFEGLQNKNASVLFINNILLIVDIKKEYIDPIIKMSKLLSTNIQDGSMGSYLHGYHTDYLNLNKIRNLLGD